MVKKNLSPNADATDVLTPLSAAKVPILICYFHMN